MSNIEFKDVSLIIEEVSENYKNEVSLKVKKKETMDSKDYKEFIKDFQKFVSYWFNVSPKSISIKK